MVGPGRATKRCIVFVLTGVSHLQRRRPSYFDIEATSELGLRQRRVDAVPGYLIEELLVDSIKAVLPYEAVDGIPEIDLRVGGHGVGVDVAIIVLVDQFVDVLHVCADLAVQASRRSDHLDVVVLILDQKHLLVPF